MFLIASLMDLFDTLFACVIFTPFLKSFSSPLGIPEFFMLVFKRLFRNNITSEYFLFCNDCNVGVSSMSDFNWCHGPQCHEKHTVDRVRGVKGSNVLRTRKVKIYSNNILWYNYICSQGCYDNFANKYIEQVIAIAPRTECLETPIKDPTKDNSRYWSTWNITVDESRQR